ncbi:MAG: 4'-phosphopantetheinyl transferase superfamily protein [Candidatus Binataceae bacterium]
MMRAAVSNLEPKLLPLRAWHRFDYQLHFGAELMAGAHRILSSPVSSYGQIAAIDHGQVHVWCIRLDASIKVVGRLRELLSHDELVRAARFVFDGDRRRFIVARAALRSILAQYLDRQPAEIRFDYGANGKPYLSGANSLSFNLSHSDELALLGVARDLEIGIDVECLDRQIDIFEIADQFFTSKEIAAIRAAVPDQQHLRFLELWTCKEAYLKALGHGLAAPLNEFDVSTLESRLGQRAEGRAGRLPGGWTIWQFTPAPDYVAALAAANERGRIVIRTLSAHAAILRPRS